VLTAVATATAGLLQVSNIVHALNLTPALPVSKHDITPSQAGAPETFLIIGSDKRAKSMALQDRLSPPHSDTLMLVRMDAQQGQTSVLSIPRDLQVTILPRHGFPSTQKINAAYSIGGTILTLQTVKRLLGPRVQINHVVDVNFAGFRYVIDAIGCVYVYVDHHYFNRNLGTIDTNFSSIDIKPGYQKLCGQTALDYARYRHTDSDFVRVARQQDFVRQVKEQVGAQGLLDNRDAIERAFGRAVQTDAALRHTSEVLRVLKLAAFTLGKPVRQVPFLATAGPSYVTATPYDIERTVDDFLHGRPKPPRPQVPHATAGGGHGRRRPASTSVPGVIAAPSSTIAAATTAAIGNPFPVYAPHAAVGFSASPAQVRRYPIRDEQGNLHRAYVISIPTGTAGQYYGVEGMDWINPPILTHPSEKRVIGSRQFELFYDGMHLKLAAWRTARAVYWVTNTLTDDLSNAQLLAIATSTRPVR
jgi:LCP family protein required for cell wall assembly